MRGMITREPPENARFIDTRPEPDYLAGHLPAAHRLDLSAPRFRLRTPEELASFEQGLAELNGALGLEPDTPVVCYDEGLTARLARTAFFLALAGNEVYLWTEGWREQAREASRVEPTPTAPWARFRRDLLLTADEALAHPKLFDVRSAEEYRGFVHPPCCPRGGRIPGARHAPLEHFFEPEGLLEQLEVRPGEEVGVYCHSGARSAVAFWVLRGLGVQARNYLGSMHEWSREEDLPLDVG